MDLSLHADCPNWPYGLEPVVMHANSVTNMFVPKQALTCSGQSTWDIHSSFWIHPERSCCRMNKVSKARALSLSWRSV